MKRVNMVVIYFLALLILSFPVFAAVTGTVTDTSGDPVTGATVTFIDESNSDNKYSDITDDKGNYEIDLTEPTKVGENVPNAFSLGQNYPNPFNPATTIPFTLKSPDHVSLIIYNIMGQKIATVIYDYKSAGNHTVTWDGMDDQGNHVSAGIYLYRFKAGRYTETKKMLLLDGGGCFGVGASYVTKSAYNSVMQSAAKIADGITYTVTIIHDSIISYKETGVVVADGQTVDFVVSLIGGTTVIQDITFVFIPGGTFEMGSNFEDDPDNPYKREVYFNDEKPVHTVTLSSFEMSAYEITNTQYVVYLTEALASGDITATSSTVTGKTGDWSGQEYLDLDDGDCEINYSGGTFTVESGKENNPVIEVTWYGSKAFALYYGLDLPTEAEWEYACRGGKQYKYGTDDGTISSSKANYNSNIGHTVDVGNYPSNPYGLYDMSGNVWEWCHDWYGDYSSDSATNPTGAQIGSCRVIRGGGWGGNADGCRSAFRGCGGPDSCGNGLGFRVVLRP